MLKDLLEDTIYIIEDTDKIYGMARYKGEEYAGISRPAKTNKKARKCLQNACLNAIKVVKVYGLSFDELASTGKKASSIMRGISNYKLDLPVKEITKDKFLKEYKCNLVFDK